MAQDDYKEGVDYEMVDKDGYQTRRFFTKKEKDAMKAPKAAAPKAKAKAKKPKFSVDMAENAINKAATKGQPMDSSPRPKPRPVDKTPTPVKLAKPGDITVSPLSSTKYGIKNYNDNLSAAQAARAKNAYKTGGMIKEGSAKDMREDKAMAKKRGMSMKKWESSAADKKHDAPKKMATDGVVKKATGGSMRGTGAAIRGKGYSGCY